MTILTFSLLFIVIAVAATIWALARGGQSPSSPHPGPARDEDPAAPAGDPGRPQGPPSAGQGLEALQSRLADMPTESLQSMLDMGATLKPGAEDLIRAELARRQESD